VIKRYDAIVTAISSISHIGEVAGNESPLHRTKIMQADGNYDLVPTITGNSVRGQWRDLGAKYLLDAVDAQNVPLGKFHLLFSGGSLEKGSADKRGAELASYREFRQTVPLLSLLGGSVGNYIMPGRLKVGMLMPVAKETSHLLPAFVIGNNDLPSVYDMVQTEQYMRRDDAQNPLREHWLNPVDAATAGVATTQQMIFNAETLAAGTRLHFTVVLEDATTLEEQALWSCVRAWSAYPTLGGQSSRGHGRVSVQFFNGDGERWVIGDDETRLPSIDEYDQYLRTTADAIREWLYGKS
jgi:hypothetical protein